MTSAGAATTWHVMNCDPSGVGSLADTVAGASSGDSIVFDQNCAGLTPIVLAAPIAISGGMALTIDGSGWTIVINGGDATRLFTVDSTSSLTLSNLFLEHGQVNGFASDGGGAIQNRGTLTLEESRVDVSQDLGTGSGSGGGALANLGASANATIRTTTFFGNNSYNGVIGNGSGAIRNEGVLTIDKSLFDQNATDKFGGAIYNNSGATLTVRNSTFSGNIAGTFGGALFNSGTATFLNDTVNGNTAFTNGSQIANVSGGTLDIANTIVSGGGTGLCLKSSATWNDNGDNLQFGDSTCGFALTGDPLFSSLADNGGPTQTLALGAGSPAIAAGDATTCQSAGVDNRDQRGTDRNADTRGACDIGAYDTSFGPPSAANSLMMRGPSKIIADGAAQSTITVTARDAFNNRVHVGGATVDLASDIGSLSGVTDNGDGTYTATLTSGTVAGTAHITGTLNGDALPGTGVDFVAGPPAPGTTTITSNKPRISIGGATATITVQAKDQYLNVVKVGGATVDLQTDLGSIGTATYVGSGRYQATLTSGNATGTATISGHIDGQVISMTITVAFTNPTVTNCFDSGPGSLRAVVAGAPTSSTVVFGVNCTGGTQLLLLNPISISGVVGISGIGHTITINGNGGRIFEVNPGGNLTLSRATLTNGGSFPDPGGAILNAGGTLIIDGVTITDSHAFGGGGAIRNGVAAILQVTNSTFNGNDAAVGGGAISSGGVTSIGGSTFTNNTTHMGPSSKGGAIMIDGFNTTIAGSTFSGNSSFGDGGAISVTCCGSLQLQNSTLSGNDASYHGGGLDIGGPAVVWDDTLADNTAGTVGGGAEIYMHNFGGYPVHQIENTIVSGSPGPAGNCAGAAPGYLLPDLGYNLEYGDSSCGFALHAASGDPLLGALANNGGPTQTRALGEGSPAIGAGSATLCTGVDIANSDQRGLSRKADTRGRCDIGAYDTRGLVAGPASGSKTTMMRNPASIVADGITTSTITVQARDALGVPLKQGGATVNLSTTKGGLSSVTDNGNGTYTATLTSTTTTGSAKVTGTINGDPITASATVTFVPGPASTLTSTIKSDKQRIPADGASTAIITMQAKDQNGNLIQVGGATVTLDTDKGSIGSVSYVGGGRYRATLTSGTTHGVNATITGTIGGFPIVSTATVRFF